jgi:hypothetical protein
LSGRPKTVHLPRLPAVIRTIRRDDFTPKTASTTRLEPL